LYRLSFPRRIWNQMESTFGMRRSHISSCLVTFGQALLKVSSKFLTNPSIWLNRMPMYSQKIYEKTGLFNNIWGFIDATLRKICRPSKSQRLLYTMYKKAHGIKFQSVVVPEGYLALFLGPYLGRTHDARILDESGLLDSLRIILPIEDENGVYALFGDCAYPMSAHLLKGFILPKKGSDEAKFNARMNSARIAVEWGFAKITQLWQYTDFKRSMKVFETRPAQHYANAAFLTNCYVAFYGNVTSEYFGMEPQGIDDYFSLVD